MVTIKFKDYSFCSADCQQSNCSRNKRHVMVEYEKLIKKNNRDSIRLLADYNNFSKDCKEYIPMIENVA